MSTVRVKLKTGEIREWVASGRTGGTACNCKVRFRSADELTLYGNSQHLRTCPCNVSNLLKRAEEIRRA